MKPYRAHRAPNRETKLFIPFVTARYHRQETDRGTLPRLPRFPVLRTKIRHPIYGTRKARGGVAKSPPPVRMVYALTFNVEQRREPAFWKREKGVREDSWRTLPSEVVVKSCPCPGPRTQGVKFLRITSLIWKNQRPARLNFFLYDHATPNSHVVLLFSELN
jgi:hypothetical protein